MADSQSSDHLLFSESAVSINGSTNMKKSDTLDPPGHDSQSPPLHVFGNVINSIVGAGVLGLPFAFMKAGWLAGAILLTIAAVLSWWGMMLLVFSKRQLAQRIAPEDRVTTFGELGLRVYGQSCQIIIDVLIVLSQGGFCCGYLIFIAENLSNLISGGIGLKWACIAGVAALEIVLSWLRSLTHLAPLSLFADVITAGAFLLVLASDITSLKLHSTVVPFTNISGIPFFLGVAVYAFEGVCMVIPLEVSMKDKPKFGATLASAMGVIIVAYASFGSLGYLAFGTETQDIITLNLAQRGFVSNGVKLGLCISLFFTFPIMMHPVYDIYESRLSWDKNFQALHLTSTQHIVAFSVLRSVCVVMVALVAVGVPNFSTFLVLVGSSVCSALAFVIPAFIHLRVMSGSMSVWAKMGDYFLIVFGILFGIWGTYDSVRLIFLGS